MNIFTKLSVLCVSISFLGLIGYAVYLGEYFMAGFVLLLLAGIFATLGISNA